MGQPTRIRFATAQEALRFYFRAQELLAKTGQQPDRDREAAARNPGHTPPPVDVVADFVRIAVCVRRLDGFERWLLGELYGPTCFYARERTLSRAVRAAQRRFPGRNASARELARRHRAAMEKLAEEFRRDGLIGATIAARILSEAS